ncbi:TylF/MycF/NovP-related O-methyltransferase [Bradyrhizobium sp. USDA 336]|uniref:TylF/MycF family methyltransferase n=1 Tax=Bradyrhizobium sp. USDA 336 TaxID=3156311 RepID=UPI0038380E79
MTQPKQNHSMLGRAARKLWVFKELYAQIGVLQDQVAASTGREAQALRELESIRSELAASSGREAQALRELESVRSELAASSAREAQASQELESIRSELAASSAREAQVSRELKSIRSELAASSAREAQASQELESIRSELAASSARESQSSRELESAKGQLAASNERADSLARSLADVARLQEHVAELSAHIHEHLPTLGNLLLGRFAEAQAVFTSQMPLLTANLVALRSGQDEHFRSLRNRLNGSVAGAGMAAADRFLDLLEASLTGTLHPDVSQAPWAKDVFDPARRAVGRDWPSRAETMIGTARMRNLRVLTQRALQESVPGDLIETGVWRGGACIYMRGILAAAGDTSRRVFVADSFRGLPAPDEAAYPADAGDQHHTFAQLAVSRAEVEANFRRYALLDEQVVFLEGWFKDTLPTAPIEKLAVLRLDGDMYESTINTLSALYGKVSPGGFVIVDDYILKACAQAVDDFRARYGIVAPMHEVDGAAIWWQVPKDSSAESPANLGGEA